MDHRLHQQLGWLNKWAVVPVDSPIDIFWWSILSKDNQKTFTLLSGTQWVVPSHVEKKFWMNSNYSQIYRYQKPQDPDGGDGVGGLWLGRGQWAQGQPMGPRPIFWGCQKRDTSWTCVWHLSKICLSMEDYDTLWIFWMENGSWTKGGQTLDFSESRDCPRFVH